MLMSMANWTRRAGFSLTAALTATALLAGCAGQVKPQPVAPEDFFARQTPTATPQIPTDQPGMPPPVRPQPPEPAIARPIEIPHAVQAVIQSTPESATTRPDAVLAPPATEPAFAPDQYLTLGSLVAEVNGKPIYVNKILRLNAATLRNLAKEYDIARFEIAARSLLERTRDEQVDSELEFAAADQALDSSEHDLAREITRRWREKQISEAGGSVEVVHRRFLAEGLDFLEAEHEKYRQFVVEIYYSKKLSPLEMVTADDERRYYRLHIADYTVPDKAEFRLLEKDPDKETRELALSHIKEYRRRALNGEDFASLVSNYSDLSVNKAQGGYFIIEGNSFALTDIQDAVLTMEPGQISDVIEDNGKFYIVKVLSRQRGGVKPFEDEPVQRAIQDTLEIEQFRKLRYANRERLSADAIVSQYPEEMDTAVQMALQNYYRWRGEQPTAAVGP
jgi:peptidyl-prolyl cis-trans isomerase SurA